MAIIVDKDQKRKDIANACTELLLEKGIKKLTVSEIAEVAGIGKGTVYDYFENKDAVVFEIIRNFMSKHQHDLKIRSNNQTSTRQKVFYLLDFFLSEFKDYSKHVNVFKEYVSVALANQSDAMISFNAECRNFFLNLLTEIIDEGIQKKEIIQESRHLILGIMACERGFLLMSWTENRCYKQELKDYINTLFDLIEIKK